jgi:hypothetical protein
MWGDGADRVQDAWPLSDGSASLAADPDEERWVANALFAYAHQAAARSGAEWFAAEFARREEEEQRRSDAAAPYPRTRTDTPCVAPQESQVVDASVEDQLVGGGEPGLGLEMPPSGPVLRHPHVPRPIAPEPAPERRRRRRERKELPAAPALPPHISAPEWARMSPGARRLYGLEDPLQPMPTP